MPVLPDGPDHDRAASGLPTAQDAWDTLTAVLNVLADTPGWDQNRLNGHLPDDVKRRRADPTQALPLPTNIWNALLDVLNTVGYTENFAQAHPHLSVSQGVTLFLNEQRSTSAGNPSSTTPPSTGIHAVTSSTSSPLGSGVLPTREAWLDAMTHDRAEQVQAWLSVEPHVATMVLTKGTSPLMLALAHRATRCWDVLWPVSDLNVVDLEGRTLVHHLAASGQTDWLRSVLPHLDPAYIKALDHDNSGPLHEAAQQGHADTIEVLLPYCNPNDSNTTGATPLMVAVRFDQHEAAQRLAPVSALAETSPTGWPRTLLLAGPSGDKVVAFLDEQAHRREVAALRHAAHEAGGVPLNSYVRTRL